MLVQLYFAYMPLNLYCLWQTQLNHNPLVTRLSINPSVGWAKSKRSLQNLATYQPSTLDVEN